MPKNLALVEAVEQLAKQKGCSVGQLALAWLHAQVTLAILLLRVLKASLVSL
jgi:aryl-alcohol dehydrogenase-like predicted oxidoreductase